MAARTAARSKKHEERLREAPDADEAEVEPPTARYEAAGGRDGRDEAVEDRESTVDETDRGGAAGPSVLGCELMCAAGRPGAWPREGRPGRG